MANNVSLDTNTVLWLVSGCHMIYYNMANNPDNSPLKILCLKVSTAVNLNNYIKLLASPSGITKNPNLQIRMSPFSYSLEIISLQILILQMKLTGAMKHTKKTKKHTNGSKWYPQTPKFC